MTQSQEISVSLDMIRTDSDIESKEKEHINIIQRFANLMRDGGDYPSILCFFDGKDYRLIYGINLLKAAELAGQKTILVDVHPNPKISRNNDDRGRIVKKVLSLLEAMGEDEKSNWSNRKIAEICGVSKSTVSNWIDRCHYEAPEVIQAYSRHGAKRDFQVNTHSIRQSNQSRAKANGFNWTAIDYKQFEKLVYAIVKAHHPVEIESRSGTGGQGRDLQAKFISKGSLGEHREEIYFIEAKHHQSEVSPNHILGALTWAQAEQPSALVIAVSSSLANKCKNVQIPEWRKNNPKVRVIYWEGKEIEDFVKFQPSTRELALEMKLISKSMFSQLTPNLSKEVLEEYQNLFIDFLEKMEQAFGKSVDKNEVRSRLSDYGFTDLVQHYIGKSCEDPEVASIMVKAFSKLLNDVQRDCSLR